MSKKIIKHLIQHQSLIPIRATVKAKHIKLHAWQKKIIAKEQYQKSQLALQETL